MEANNSCNVAVRNATEECLRLKRASKTASRAAKEVETQKQALETEVNALKDQKEVCICVTCIPPILPAHDPNCPHSFPAILEQSYDKALQEDNTEKAAARRKAMEELEGMLAAKRGEVQAADEALDGQRKTCK